MKKLYFIRHGESEMNALGRISGHTDTPLTPLGRSQGKKAGQAAKDLEIDLVVSSPLKRAYETAQIIAHQIDYPKDKIVTNPLLVERFYGALEGAPYGVRRDNQDISDYETDKMLVARAQEALDWINGLEADHILVVSHGATGRAIRSLLKKDYPMNHPEKLNNAELVCWVES